MAPHPQTVLPHTSLLLVGAGHAHLYLIAHANRLAAAGYALTLLAPRDFRYSGMASAGAVGALDPGEGRIDVARLARAHGVEHVDARLSDLDVPAKKASTDTGVNLAWDVLSVNTGSVSMTTGIDEIDAEVVRVKPLDGLAQLSSRLRSVQHLAEHQGRKARITVVGGGSTGAELAGHLATRGGVEVRLVEAGSALVPALPAAARAHVRGLLRRRGVSVHTDAPVRRVAADRVELTAGQSFPHDLALLATGLSADPLMARLGLTATGPSSIAPPLSPDAETGDQPTDGIPVAATLEYLGAGDVYAVGDCAHFTPSPLAKIGVHGVRQGPVLLDSLIRRAAGAALPTYTPPPHPLQILDLGGGVALAARGQRWWCGRSALLAKRWIDRRWLASYR